MAIKTLIVECKFVIEVPWDEEWGDPYFQIEENSCPSTSAVGGVLSKLMENAEEARICWACMVGGENKILAIEEREPRDYVDEITFKEEPLAPKPCSNCGAPLTGSTKRNAGIIEKHTKCEACGDWSHSMTMGGE